MRKLIAALSAIVLLLLPSASAAGNLIVVVKDAVTNLPVQKATVTLVVFNDKEQSWQQEWWGAETQENGIALRLGLEMWQKLVIRAESKGYFSTFYGMPFCFYGVPEVLTISSANTRVEIFLQPEEEPPKPKVLRTVKK